MATNKGGGSTRNGRDSNPQYLGVKAYGGETIKAGSIIVRQRGNEVFPRPQRRFGPGSYPLCLCVRCREVRRWPRPSEGQRLSRHSEGLIPPQSIPLFLRNRCPSLQHPP
jgi:hypothetical protein